jgi:3-oxosteroid 1-dehydrogenase
LRVALGKLTGKHWVTAGAGLQGRLLQAGLKAGIDIRLESPVSELVVEQWQGVGVVTVKNGKPWRIGARLGVLVNAGGFAQNQAMRDKYQPGTKAAWSNTPEGDTGEMHLEMERIGGVLAQMDEMVGFQTTRSPALTQDFRQAGHAGRHRQAACHSGRSVGRALHERGRFLRALLRNHAQAQPRRCPPFRAGRSWTRNSWRNISCAAPPASKEAQELDRERLSQAGRHDRGTGEADQGRSCALKATVDRWNSFVVKGVDEDFHRGERAYDNWLGDPFFKDGPNKSMGRIEKGPFYAVDVIPGDVSTYGGVVTDAHSRVLRGDGS